MARYLVTGGCGFIGSHLADALSERGDTVRILDDLSTGSPDHAPRAAQLIVGDVADPDIVAGAMIGMDGCFHLAAISSVARSNEEWLATHRVNLGGTINVLDASRHASGGPLPVVYASSAAVYGDAPERPLHEAVAPRPLTAYGADKLGCELHARVGAAVHGLPSVGLRLFNIYGPRQDPASPYAGVIALFVERLSAGRPVTVFGDGEQTRDFVYVADAVRFFLEAMDRAAAGAAVYNVCTGRAVTILELAQVICEVHGARLNVQHGPERPGDIRASLGSPEHAAARLGIRAGVSLKQGLDQMVAALRAAS